MRERILSTFFGALSLFLFSCSDKPASPAEGNSSATESSGVDTETPPLKEALAPDAGQQGGAEETVQTIPPAGAGAQAQVQAQACGRKRHARGFRQEARPGGGEVGVVMSDAVAFCFLPRPSGRRKMHRFLLLRRRRNFLPPARGQRGGRASCGHHPPTLASSGRAT